MGSTRAEHNGGPSPLENMGDSEKIISTSLSGTVANDISGNLKKDSLVGEKRRRQRTDLGKLNGGILRTSIGSPANPKDSKASGRKAKTGNRLFRGIQKSLPLTRWTWRNRRVARRRRQICMRRATMWVYQEKSMGGNVQRNSPGGWINTDSEFSN